MNDLPDLIARAMKLRPETPVTELLHEIINWPTSTCLGLGWGGYDRGINEKRKYITNSDIKKQLEKWLKINEWTG